MLYHRILFSHEGQELERERKLKHATWRGGGGFRFYETGKVRGAFTVTDFKGKEKNFKLDTLNNWQPVEIAEDWSNMFIRS